MDMQSISPAETAATTTPLTAGALPVAGGVGTDVFPPLISDLYREAPTPLKRKMLDCLLRPVGPLALVVLAAGAFSNLLPTSRWQRLNVSLDDALRIDAGQVLELARYVDQKCPEVFQQIGALLTQQTMVVSTLSGSLLLLALRAWLKRDGAGQRAALAKPDRIR